MTPPSTVGDTQDRLPQIAAPTLQRDSLPAELTALPQWLVWRSESRLGKRTKVPHTCQGYRAAVTNPDHWSAFDYALAASVRQDFADGLGFVFTPDDPFTGIDLDNCFPSDAVEHALWAGEILERFRDTYSEVSPSGRGVKIWCRAVVPRSGRWSIQSGAIEIYSRARFFTVTGQSNGILTVADHQADVESLCAYLDEGEQNGPCRPAVIPDRIQQGTRHNTLVSLAGSMYRRGMSAEAIEAALTVTNERQCDPPYDRGHIRQIMESTAAWHR